MYKKIMSKLTNGNKPSWLAILTTISLILIVLLNWTRVTDRFFNKGVGSALMAQAVETNTTNIDTISKQMVERDKRFDKFLIQQTVKNALDSVKTETIIELLKEQKIFNGKVTEHIIKSGNE